MVIGRNDSADFDYAFGWGDITGEVRLPTLDNKAFVGARDDPERFRCACCSRPPPLTPQWHRPISLKGVDASELTVTLRNSDTGHTYPAEIINSSYVSGEYWLVVQAPSITDPGDSDIFDLENLRLRNWGQIVPSCWQVVSPSPTACSPEPNAVVDVPTASLSG